MKFINFKKIFIINSFLMSGFVYSNSCIESGDQSFSTQFYNKAVELKEEDCELIGRDARVLRFFQKIQNAIEDTTLELNKIEKNILYKDNIKRDIENRKQIKRVEENMKSLYNLSSQESTNNFVDKMVNELPGKFISSVFDAFTSMLPQHAGVKFGVQIIKKAAPHLKISDKDDLNAMKKKLKDHYKTQLKARIINDNININEPEHIYELAHDLIKKQKELSDRILTTIKKGTQVGQIQINEGIGGDHLTCGFSRVPSFYEQCRDKNEQEYKVCMNNGAKENKEEFKKIVRYHLSNKYFYEKYRNQKVVCDEAFNSGTVTDSECRVLNDYFAQIKICREQTDRNVGRLSCKKLVSYDSEVKKKLKPITDKFVESLLKVPVYQSLENGTKCLKYKRQGHRRVAEDCSGESLTKGAVVVKTNIYTTKCDNPGISRFSIKQRVGPRWYEKLCDVIDVDLNDVNINLFGGKENICQQWKRINPGAYIPENGREVDWVQLVQQLDIPIKLDLNWETNHFKSRSLVTFPTRSSGNEEMFVNDKHPGHYAIRNGDYRKWRSEPALICPSGLTFQTACSGDQYFGGPKYAIGDMLDYSSRARSYRNSILKKLKEKKLTCK